MQQTANYALKKIELADSPPDITVLNSNFDTIDTKLKENADAIETHKADIIYQTAGGTATAITLTGVVLENGHPKTFIASANNNGSATTINAKPLYKPSTVASPTLIAGKAYTVWYNLAGNCFFVKASAEGNAVAEHVLAGDIFSNENDSALEGKMPSKVGSATTIVPNGYDQIIPQGYYGGNGGDGKVAGIPITASTFEVINIQTTKAILGGVNVMTKAREIRVNHSGSIQIMFGIYMFNKTYTGTAQVYKNDVAVGILRTTQSLTEVLFAENFNCVAGDRFEIYMKNSGAVSPNADVWLKTTVFSINNPGYVTLLS